MSLLHSNLLVWRLKFFVINREFDFLCFFQDINTRLKNIINGAPCVLFMKGSPQEPLCGLCQHLYFCAVNLMCRGDREEWLGMVGICKCGLLQFRQFSSDQANASCGFVFHWGQWITIPRVHVTWCGVVTRAWCLPIVGVSLCLCVRESLQILAYHHGSIGQCFKGIFADLLLLVQFLAECWSCSTTVSSKSLQIQSWSLRINNNIVNCWCGSESSSQPSLPFKRTFQIFLVSIWGPVEYFSTDLVSVWQCQLVAAYMGGFSLRGCHGYLPALACGAQAPCQPSGCQFPSSSLGDEFKEKMAPMGKQ